MNKKLRILLISFSVLAIILIGGFKYMQSSTKKHSPEQKHSVLTEGLRVDVFYNSPARRDRKIFGELVPFGQVWRTGANEPTTVTFSQEVAIGGQRLEPGTYSIWTIPQPDTWEVIFNGGDYSWGVSWGGVASRDPEFDVARVKVPVVALGETVENLTIGVNEEPLAIELTWENTLVQVPIGR